MREIPCHRPFVRDSVSCLHFLSFRNVTLHDRCVRLEVVFFAPSPSFRDPPLFLCLTAPATPVSSLSEICRFFSNGCLHYSWLPPSGPWIFT